MSALPTTSLARRARYSSSAYSLAVRSISSPARVTRLDRVFTDGGYAALTRVHSWMLGFVDRSPQGERYRDLADRITEALAFMEACGVTDVSTPEIKRTTLYTSHEALLLGFEQAMTRIDSTSGLWYDTSAHFVWVGERTRDPEGAHVEFCRGIANPVGMKAGPRMTPDELLRLCDMLNPANEAVTSLTIEQLGEMWAPESPVATWADVDAALRADPLNLYGTGEESGTYQFFTQVTVGEEGVSRDDYTVTDGHPATADAVADDPNGLGFLPFPRYLENQDRLKLVQVDGGSGCVAPSAEKKAR